MKKKGRNSSIELLKVFSLIIITIQHCLRSSSINFGSSISNPLLIAADVFRCGGYLGNTIFIICSSYFLLNSNSINKKKIMYIIANTFVISLLWFIPFIIMNIHLSKMEIIMEIFPISFGNNWFIGCYILLYLLHPFLNKIINSCDKNSLLRINIVFITLYCIIQFFIKDSYFFNGLVLFVMLYFITAYLKYYMKSFCSSRKLNYLLLGLSIFLYISFTYISNLLSIKVGYFSENILFFNFNMANPFIIMIGITLFNVANSYSFNNNFINYLSSLSLVYYVLHENILFREILRPQILRSIIDASNSTFFGLLIMISLLIVVGGCLSIIFKETILICVKWVVDILYELIKKIYYKIEKILLVLQ